MLRFLILSGYFELGLHFHGAFLYPRCGSTHRLDEADEGSLAFVRSSSQGSQHRSLGLSSPYGTLGANSYLRCQYRVS